MAEEFRYQTSEEIAALPTFPEPEADETDGGKSAHSSGYVYFVTESGNENVFKVGRTVNPERRRKTLQTAQPEKLNMKYVKVSDMANTERDLLKAMKKWFSQACGGKEWFYGDVGEAQDLFISTVDGY
jgi:hypothetical protein